MDAVATILAGGVDIYLWPLSREKFPKFLLPLEPDGSMLQSTLEHLRPVLPRERIAVATTAALVPLVRKHLPDLPEEQFIVEPLARGTAACLALSTLWWEQRFPADTVLLFLPADHSITHLGEYHHSLELAIQAASTYQRPVVLGLPPQRPETRFGYIQVETSTESELTQRGLFRVRTFAEKPDLETARRFLESGDFLWNSGIVLLPLGKIWELFQQYLPEYYTLFAPLRTQPPDSGTVDYIYRQLRPLSLERGLLEAAAREMLALRCTFDWSDVGTWDELYRRALKDPRGNVLHGDVIAVDINGCFVHALGGKPIALVGVSDLIVVDAEQALLICPRGASERVAELVHYLRRRKIRRLL